MKFATVFALLLAVGATNAADGEFDYSKSGMDWPGTCSTGLRQTPIDIDTTTAVPPVDEKVDAIVRHGPSLLGALPIIPTPVDSDEKGPLHLEVDAEAFKASGYNADAVAYLANMLKISEEEVRALAEQYVGVPLQYHLHSTGEHTVDGQIFAAEGHLVRAVPCADPTDVTLPDQDTCLGVYGVLYTLGAPSTAIDVMIGSGPSYTPKDTLSALDFAWVYPISRKHISYTGSLTTPPCSEPLAWTVFLEPMTMSSDQLVMIQNIIAADGKTGGRTNNRLTMPVNDRTLYMGI